MARKTFIEKLPNGKKQEWQVLSSVVCAYPIAKGTKLYICKDGENYSVITEHEKK